jgi:large subunit ribosomal protein L4
MLKTQLDNQKIKEPKKDEVEKDIIKKTDLPDSVFGLDFNPDLVHQVVVSQMANRRQVSAHTKDRGDVRGGGKKPWRQKGTGRARVGSNRSPIWRGGGITFGPTNERNFKKIIPLKMKRKALLIALSQKARDNQLIILDEIKIDKPKTKEMATLIAEQKKEKGSLLIVIPEKDESIVRAGKNIANTAIMQAKDLNCLDVLKYKYIMMTEKAIDVIEKTFVL